jgi:hypothetical protein
VKGAEESKEGRNNRVKCENGRENWKRKKLEEGESIIR